MMAAIKNVWALLTGGTQSNPHKENSRTASDTNFSAVIQPLLESIKPLQMPRQGLATQDWRKKDNTEKATIQSSADPVDSNGKPTETDDPDEQITATAKEEHSNRTENQDTELVKKPKPGSTITELARGQTGTSEAKNEQVTATKLKSGVSSLFTTSADFRSTDKTSIGGLVKGATNAGKIDSLLKKAVTGTEQTSPGERTEAGEGSIQKVPKVLNENTTKTIGDISAKSTLKAVSALANGKTARVSNSTGLRPTHLETKKLNEASDELASSKKVFGKDQRIPAESQGRIEDVVKVKLPWRWRLLRILPVPALKARATKPGLEVENTKKGLASTVKVKLSAFWERVKAKVDKVESQTSSKSVVNETSTPEKMKEAPSGTSERQVSRSVVKEGFSAVELSRANTNNLDSVSLIEKRRLMESAAAALGKANLTTESGNRLVLPEKNLRAPANVRRLAKIIWEQFEQGQSSSTGIKVEAGALGEIEMFFQTDSAQKQITITVASEIARREVQRILPIIQANLSLKGMEIDNFLVMSRNSEGQPEYGSQSERRPATGNDSTVDQNQEISQPGIRDYGYNTFEYLA